MWKWMLVLALIGAPAWADDTADIMRLKTSDPAAFIELVERVFWDYRDCVNLNGAESSQCQPLFQKLGLLLIDGEYEDEAQSIQEENRKMREAITGFSVQCVGINPEDIWRTENLEDWARAFGGDVNAEKKHWLDCRNTYLQLVHPFALPENEIDWSKIENSQQ